MIYPEATLKLLLKYKWDLLAVFLLALTAPLFFYKLGQSSLVSWDEAWYAGIARNILNTGDLFNLTWNGKAYFDHPPLGFWLIALVFKIFGISEFWARFTPAFLGFLSIFLLYFLGKEVFSRIVGFASTLALSSTIWFLFRARSGNLDVILTFFFILAFFLAFKSLKNRRFLYPLAASLALLFLSKTLVPLIILPAFLTILWGKYTFQQLVKPALVFLLISAPWLFMQVIYHPEFLERYLFIGFPGAEIKTSYLDNLLLTKTYLHSGIGKWFWPAILSLPLGLIFWQKKLLIFPIFSLIFLLPTIFSHKTQIWHLIPLYPFLILNFFGVAYLLLRKLLKRQILATILVLGFSFYLSHYQTRQNWYQFVDIPAFVSDEATLSKEAGKYPHPYFIDGDFDPVASFYSGKNVQKIYALDLVPLFLNEKQFLLITYQWRLDQANISKEKYRIIKTDRDKILVLKE